MNYLLYTALKAFFLRTWLDALHMNGPVRGMGGFLAGRRTSRRHALYLVLPWLALETLVWGRISTFGHNFAADSLWLSLVITLLFYLWPLLTYLAGLSGRLVSFVSNNPAAAVRAGVARTVAALPAGLKKLPAVLRSAAEYVQALNWPARAGALVAAMPVPGALFLFFAALLIWHAVFFPVYDFDSLIYHLTTPASWYQMGRIDVIPASTSRHLDWWLTYPAGGELVFLNTMLVTGNDLWVQGVNILSLLLCYSLIVDLSRFFSADRRLLFRRAAGQPSRHSSAATATSKADTDAPGRFAGQAGHWAALMFCTIPIVAGQANSGYVDLMFAFAVLATLYFIILAARSRLRLVTMMAFALCAAFVLSIKASGFLFGLLFILFFMWPVERTMVFRRNKQVRQNGQTNTGHTPLARLKTKIVNGLKAVRMGRLVAFSLLIVGCLWLGLYFYVRVWVDHGNPFFPYEFKVGERLLFEGEPSWWLGNHGPTQSSRYTTWIDGTLSENWRQSLWDLGSLSRFNLYYATYRGGGGPALVAVLLPLAAAAGLFALLQFIFFWLQSNAVMLSRGGRALKAYTAARGKNRTPGGQLGDLFRHTPVVLRVMGVFALGRRHLQLLGLLWILFFCWVLYDSQIDLFRFLIIGFALLAVAAGSFLARLSLVGWLMVPVMTAVFVLQLIIFGSLNFRKPAHYDKIMKSGRPLALSDMPRDIRLHRVNELFPGSWNVAYSRIYMPYELFDGLRKQVSFIKADDSALWRSEVEKRGIEIYVAGRRIKDGSEVDTAHKKLIESSGLFTLVETTDDVHIYMRNNEAVKQKRSTALAAAAGAASGKNGDHSVQNGSSAEQQPVHLRIYKWWQKNVRPLIYPSE